ncbi:hypothetical protein [Hymenobacter yonginensis]|uniref:Uncharacterized protein n=1 Tax=Hymenobacter yonginensis TaxID=748197 RepID=A0ABY7PMU0_9BACT|nr:hypothetical protein [Hymenobacter yonginensis]WBO84553.1 hypothetical protein O9Z63_19575 [Hymenobacter yonginensis]
MPIPPARYLMADINIQRKKNSPSPWLLILLVLAVVGAAAWFLFRSDTPASTEPVASPTAEPAPTRTDSTAGAETGPRPNDAAVADMAPEAAPVTPEVLAAFARTDATQPTYALEGLRLLTAALVDLADRDDLRTAAISEKRDNLTSATARLDEPNASLRPGFVAATGLMQAMQQQAYPGQEAAVADLITRATQLSGRNATALDHQQLQEFFTRAASLVRILSSSATV